MVVTGCRLYERLKVLGIDLGVDCEEVRIVLPPHPAKVQVLRKYGGLRQITHWDCHTLKFEEYDVLSANFLNELREAGVNLPDEITSLEVIIRRDEVVKIKIEAGLPEDSLDFMQYFKLTEKE